MKKQIIKTVSFVLVFVLMALSLTSCFIETPFGGDDDDTAHTHNFVKKFNARFSYEECTICGFKTDECPITNSGESDQNENQESFIVLENNSELVLELISYLRLKSVKSERGPLSTEIKIDIIVSGAKPVLVDFDSSSYYIVCAYYNSTHDIERINYCCADKYIWVKYAKEADIKEYYNDQELVVSFQINKASFVWDMSSDTANAISFEHFREFKAVFENGKNIYQCVPFDKVFIYSNTSDEENIYYSLSLSGSVFRTFNCAKIDEQYFIPYYLYRIYPDGHCSVTDLSNKLRLDFGKYYDELSNMLIYDKYIFIRDNGAIDYYALIDVNEFSNAFVNKGE
ncbi:MAG: hypothetical protein IKW53_03670 [Clostridia bacterium]|nr:hypothetical protein [Clostridia bacterium]